MLNQIRILCMVLMCFDYPASGLFFHNHLTNLHVSKRQHNAVSNDYPVLGAKYGPFFMKMPMDHFDETNSKNFNNRFWANTDHYKSKGPLILYNVGESAADDSAILVIYSAMAQLAEKLNGVVVVMEHRFYGASGPNNHTKEDLLTFNVKQSIADMAYLAKHIKFHNVNIPMVPQTKVIVYGCSYSGALAAWAKDTYPDLFFAAVSSSAPVQAKMDFFEYYVPIMQFGPKHCILALQNVITYIDRILFANSTKDIFALKKIFSAQNLLDESFAECK
ncbi:serine carboxypeptidase S28-domain-containing protein, partial [Mucor mucedo]|uniref:serine carboxypeptidase S28-domain-containing protein n=1 Tax=Mucor mucedo TaxID=29922 RepID=UPI00221FE210